MSPFYTAQRSRRARVASLVAVAGSLLLVVAATALGAARRPLDLRSGHGLRIESVETIDARQLAVRVSTDALQQSVDQMKTGLAEAKKILQQAGYRLAGGKLYYPAGKQEKLTTE